MAHCAPKTADEQPAFVRFNHHLHGQHPDGEHEESGMVKVVRFHETGGPEVLRIEDLPPREPWPGEVRLRVEAIGLNRAEALFRSGQYLDAAKFPARSVHRGRQRLRRAGLRH
jgi:hypothetical protein